MANNKIILGIDPGTIIMGYSLIEIKNNKPELILMDVLKLGRISSQALKLKKIFESTLRIVETYKPDELSIEAPFYGKNAQSMLKLGRAQGVAMAACLYRDIPIFEYSPRKVKQSITGNGAASKEQLAAMLPHLLEIKEMPKYFDATDALAIAICHHLQANSISSSKSYSGWDSYVAKNPNKIKK